MTDRWTCVVPFVDRAGDRHMIVVTLAPDERRDALMHLALRGPDGPGGDDGLIVRNYASRRAAEKVPPDFVPLYGEIERVVLH